MRRCNDIFNCIAHCGRGHCGSCSCRCGHLALDAPFYRSRSTAEGAAEGAGANPSPAVWLGESNWHQLTTAAMSGLANGFLKGIRSKKDSISGWHIVIWGAPTTVTFRGLSFLDILGGGFYTPSILHWKDEQHRKIQNQANCLFFVGWHVVLMHIVCCFDFPIAAKVSFGQSLPPEMARKEHFGRCHTSKPCSCQLEASRVLLICLICSADSRLGLSSCEHK